MPYFDMSRIRLVPASDGQELEEWFDRMFRTGDRQDLATDATSRNTVLEMDGRGHITFHFYPMDAVHREMFRDRYLERCLEDALPEEVFTAKVSCTDVSVAGYNKDMYCEVFACMRSFLRAEGLALTGCLLLEDEPGEPCSFYLFGHELDRMAMII